MKLIHVTKGRSVVVTGWVKKRLGRERRKEFQRYKKLKMMDIDYLDSSYGFTCVTYVKNVSMEHISAKLLLKQVVR